MRDGGMVKTEIKGAAQPGYTGGNKNVPGGFEAGKRYELICSFVSLF